MTINRSRKSMSIQARSKRTNKKRGRARRAPKPGTTATDRRLLAKAAREDSDALRAAAKQVVSHVESLAAAERAAADRRSAAREKVKNLPVSMTLSQLCTLLGHDIDPENFASSMLDSVADQMETIAVIVDSASDFSEDAWRLFKNLAERTKYAGKVVSWLGSGKPAELPEVQP